MKISILTATYNRADYLGKLYKSIVDNIDSSYDIEWLIMDDGSTDDTEAVCAKFVDKDNLIVKYFKQENQGKMQAINNLAKYVSGDLWIECDSDDYFVNEAFKNIYIKYKNNEKNLENVYGFCFLKYDQNGNNMGKKFKSNKSTMFDLYFKDGENGEKAIVFMTDIRKKYFYELEHNEKFITEARMYHKMDLKYKMICINEKIMICEYRKDGYSKNINKSFLESPYGYYKYFYEILNDMNTKNIKMSKRMYAIKHYILFSYLTHQKCKINKKDRLNRLLLKILYIPGYIKSYIFKKRTNL